MESHPVPQNVTSFEFHLVGDMTIKQFAYLAGGVGIAYVIFVTVGTKIPFIAIPFVVLFSLIGIAFAFVPISERPLDHWVGAFIQAIVRPTQRKWESKTANENLMGSRLSLYLASLNQQPMLVQTPPASPTLTQRAQTPAQQISPQPQIIKISDVPPAPKQNLPSSEELAKTVELAKKSQDLQNQIVVTEKDLNQIKTNAAAPGIDPKIYAEKFQTVLGNLQDLTKEASSISQEMAQLDKSAPKEVSAPKVVVIAAKQSTPINLTLTSTANIINGVVTDAMGNYLEGVIVVTHDKQGLPVRALKTNKLGQFVAATPLPVGTYTITLEKENLSFDTIQIDLDGKVMPPILIAAKKGGA